LVARLLHDKSGIPDGPFVDLNCATLAESVREIELFGVEKGTFPGAEGRRVGLMELAAGGTLYLDNVGELDVRTQGLLLRALETGSFCRVGGAQKVEVNLRVIASTTADISRMAVTGAFRDDLLHRINTIRIALPPLRERIVDVPLLARHFLDQFAGSTPPLLTADAIIALERYRWPGNVRELRNVIERAVLLAVNGAVDARDLPLGDDVGAGARATPPFNMTLTQLERQHIAATLERHHWHQGKAAEVLGISPKTLYRTIREYGFRRPSGRGI
ncbi:MAG: sigma 54-interacting transcriptional regulator, partial [Gemmatimonas sp.]